MSKTQEEKHFLVIGASGYVKFGTQKEAIEFSKKEFTETRKEVVVYNSAMVVGRVSAQTVPVTKLSTPRKAKTDA